MMVTIEDGRSATFVLLNNKIFKIAYFQLLFHEIDCEFCIFGGQSVILCMYVMNNVFYAKAFRKVLIIISKSASGFKQQRGLSVH